MRKSIFRKSIFAIAAILIVFIVGVRIGISQGGNVQSHPASEIIGKVSDADKIDGYDTSLVPAPNKILVSDALGKFPISAITQGAGSGLDADKVDGYQASDLLAAGGAGAITNSYSHLYFYFTKTAHNGNLGGISGANTICQNDKPYGVPDGLTYKAYLCDSTRCQKPEAGDNTIVVINSGTINLDNYVIVNPIKGPDFATSYYGKGNYLKNGISGLNGYAGASFGPAVMSSGVDVLYWTGAATGAVYTNAYGGEAVTDLVPGAGTAGTCNDWSSSSGSNGGRYGSAGYPFTSNYWIIIGTPSCNNAYKIICYAS